MSVRRELSRRDFLKGAVVVGLGSSVFFLVLPRGSQRWVNTAFRRRLSSLGTRVNVYIFDTVPSVAEEATAAAFQEIEEIHWLMSTHEPASQLSGVNQAAGSEFVSVDPRVAEVVKQSLEFSRISSGIFDPTTLPLLEAWGFRNYRFDQAPDESRILDALHKVGYEQVMVSDAGVGLKIKGSGIDLGGIAKGYAVDRASAILRRYGISRFIVEAGGDLFAASHPIDRPTWYIGVKHPLRSGECAVVNLVNQAVATSGISESFVTYNGKRYGHLFDPRTGQPVETYLSTSVVGPTALEADAGSTTIFVAGRNAGRQLVLSTSSWLNIYRGRDGKLVYEASSNFPGWDELPAA